MMFKLNTLQKTKDGELLMPFVVNGNTVSCFNSKKETVYRKLSDFDFTPEPKETPVLSVMAKEDLNTDALFEEEAPDNDLVSDTTNTNDIDSGNSVVETPPQEDTGDATDNQASSDTGTEPTTGTDTGTTGSIWDTVNDDDYI